jgi:hypoxanthine phosphoribosyltransferase
MRTHFDSIPTPPEELELLFTADPNACRARLEATILDDVALACYREMLEADKKAVPDGAREPLHASIRVEIMKGGLGLVSDEVVGRLIRDGEALGLLGFDVIPFLRDSRSYWHGKDEAPADWTAAEFARPPIRAAQIHAKVSGLVQRIKREYAGKSLMITPVLTGGLVFAMDLFRGLADLSPALEPVVARSYDGTRARRVLIDRGMLDRLSFRDRHILIVDDILDTGQTLTELTRLISLRGPASVKTCVFLKKEAGKSRRVYPFEPDFLGFRIPDVFVVGYGLDFRGRYRSLPDIVTLPEGEDDATQAREGFQIVLAGSNGGRRTALPLSSLELTYTGVKALRDVKFTVVLGAPRGWASMSGPEEVLRKPITSRQTEVWNPGERQSIPIDSSDLDDAIELVELTLEARIGDRPVRMFLSLDRVAILHESDEGRRSEHFRPLSEAPAADDGLAVAIAG